MKHLVIWFPPAHFRACSHTHLRIYTVTIAVFVFFPCSLSSVAQLTHEAGPWSRFICLKILPLCGCFGYTILKRHLKYLLFLCRAPTKKFAFVEETLLGFPFVPHPSPLCLVAPLLILFFLRYNVQHAVCTCSAKPQSYVSVLLSFQINSGALNICLL